jgi:hypothetical protein
VSTEAAIKLQEALNSERSEKKRNGQAERIDGKENDALDDRVLFGGESENDCQNGAYTRGPAEGESEADDKCAPRRASSLYLMQALSKNNDDDSGED